MPFNLSRQKHVCSDTVMTKLSTIGLSYHFKEEKQKFYGSLCLSIVILQIFIAIASVITVPSHMIQTLAQNFTFTISKIQQGWKDVPIKYQKQWKKHLWILFLEFLWKIPSGIVLHSCNYSIYTGHCIICHFNLKSFVHPH